MAIVQTHRDNLQELAAEVPRSKWVWLGLLNAMDFGGTTHTDANVTKDGNGPRPDQQQQRLAILQTLLELDDDRRERYLYLLERLEEEGE